MRYKVSLTRSEEGVSASVLGLPGCHSQGTDEADAIANVRDAIRDYLAVQRELWTGRETREVEVEV